MNTEPTADTPDAIMADAGTESAETLGRIVTRWAGLLASEHFPRGEHAALRRLDPAAPSAPAFWRLLFEHVPEQRRRTSESESRWALVLHGLALMSRPNASAHRTGAGIGAVLAEAGFSELRLNRLLRARGEGFRQMVPRVCRYLAAKNAAVDWVRFARWLLADEARAEEHRRQVARDYFRARSRPEAEEDTSGTDG